MPDRDDPPKKRQVDNEPERAKPTRDREPGINFDPTFPDLDGPQGGRELDTPRGRPSADQEPGNRGPAAEPDRPRATADQTRQRASGVSIPDELRSYLDRLGDIEDEISDQEAARRAGLSTDDGAEPVPPEYQTLPAVIRNDLANIGGELRAAGQQFPEWHTINNLPGYMKNAIRAMGRGNFRMFTRTDLEDITTIANVGGKGPNTEAEVKAVAAWLMQNAENLGPVEIDYSQIMPGYEPEVVEFRTEKTRFHVVRDPAGIYIYAYPEKDAVDRTGTASLPGPDQGGDNERDEFGARIKRISKESKMENKFTSVSEQIRHYTNVLESLQEQALEEQQGQELWESLVDSLFEASSLMKLLKGKPGSKELATHLHRQFKLASGVDKKRPDYPSIVPNYALVPARLHASAIKASRDNFAIIIGTGGVAAVKALDEDWEGASNPTKDNTMRYRVIWAAEGQQADAETRKYRLGLRTGGGGSSGMESGGPNLFQVLIERIGQIQDIYIAEGAVERMKMHTREKYKASPDTSEYKVVDTVVEKLKPVLLKLLNTAVGNIQQRVGRLSQAGNFDQSRELAAAGAKIQNMLTALDTDNPNYGARPLTSFKNLVSGSIRQLIRDKDDAEKQEILKGLSSGQANALRDLLNTVRQGLYKMHQVSEY